MKYLKIDGNKGYFWDGSEYQEIEKIGKDELLTLIGVAELDDFEIDPYDEAKIANKAHQIIYESIAKKFTEFLYDKEQFNRDVESLYSEAIGKYAASLEDKAEETPALEEVEQEDINPEDIPF